MTKQQAFCAAGWQPDSGMTTEAVTAFFDRLAPSWDRDLEIDTAKINCILDASGIRAGTRVLDVACGTGVLFPFYASRDAAHITGVDLSPEMVKLARSKIAGNSRFEVLCGDIEALQATGDYDCCVVYNAFPHFPQPARLIKSLSAWLKPNGRLTVAHSMSVEALNRHHSASAAAVSRGMLSAEELAALFGAWFSVDASISDNEKFIVSGTLLLPEKAGAR